MKISSCDWFPSPNYTKGGIIRIEYIMMHSTIGGFAGALSWLCNPASKASAHFLVGMDGRKVQLVDTADRAWHAASKWWNSRAIGIELEYLDEDYKAAYPQPQLWSAAELVAKVELAHNVFPQLVGHSVVPNVGKRDPGPMFPWPAFQDMIQSHKTGTTKKQPWEVEFDEAWDWASQAGIIKGGRKDMVTREALAVILHRLKGV